AANLGAFQFGLERVGTPLNVFIGKLRDAFALLGDILHALQTFDGSVPGVTPGSRAPRNSPGSGPGTGSGLSNPGRRDPLSVVINVPDNGQSLENGVTKAIRDYETRNGRGTRGSF